MGQAAGQHQQQQQQQQQLVCALEIDKPKMIPKWKVK